jgi:hypothetical protein
MASMRSSAGGSEPSRSRSSGMGWTVWDDRASRTAGSGTEPDTDSERLTGMRLSPLASVRSRWLLPVAAAALVAAVLVVVSAVNGMNGATAPPVLHLAGIAGGSMSQPVQPAAVVSGKGGAVGGSPSGSGWRLEGTLPNGSSSGRVHLLPDGTTAGAAVIVLARALGMSGEPQHLNGGWYLLSGTTELSVSELAGRHWTYSNHGCIAGPVLDPQTGTACAVAHSAPPIPPPPTPRAPRAPPASAHPRRLQRPSRPPSHIQSRRMSPGAWPAQSLRPSVSTRSPRWWTPRRVSAISSSAPGGGLDCLWPRDPGVGGPAWADRGRLRLAGDTDARRNVPIDQRPAGLRPAT